KTGGGRIDNDGGRGDRPQPPTIDVVHGGAVRVNCSYLLQFLFHIAGDIGFLLSGIFFCGGDGEPVPIDSDDTLKLIEQCLSEESCTAVSIDEEILIRRN